MITKTLMGNCQGFVPDSVGAVLAGPVLSNVLSPLTLCQTQDVAVLRMGVSKGPVVGPLIVEDDECNCVLPEHSCPSCRAAARSVCGDEIPF